MPLFRRAQSSRDYYGVTVTGNARRFRDAKTAGARRADRQGQAWEDRDRAQDRRSRWYRPAR
jgi:hypothetical protein